MSAGNPNNGPLSPTASAPLGLRRGVEKPRPLRTTPLSPTVTASTSITGTSVASVDEVMPILDRIHKSVLNGCAPSSVTSDIIGLNAALKTLGPFVETLHKEQLDMYMDEFTKWASDGRFDLVARLHIVEILELRGMKWAPNDTVSNYYKQKLVELGYNPNGIVLTPASDAGPAWPINAIMNGTLALKDHGPQRAYQVNVGNEVINLSGNNDSLLKTAKIILTNYFSEHRLGGEELVHAGSGDHESSDIMGMLKVLRQPLFPASSPEAFAAVESNLTRETDRMASDRRANFAKTNAFNDAGTRREIRRYDRDFLIQCALSEDSQRPPVNLSRILTDFPDLERKDVGDNNNGRAPLDYKPQRRLATTNNQQLNYIKKHLTPKTENVTRIWDSEKNQWVQEQGPPTRA